MVVTVKLYATLRKYYPDLGIGEGMKVELPEGATVGQLLNHLRLPSDVVRVAFVNGIARDENYSLSDGDEVGLFPPVGGG